MRSARATRTRTERREGKAEPCEPRGCSETGSAVQSLMHHRSHPLLQARQRQHQLAHLTCHHAAATRAALGCRSLRFHPPGHACGATSRHPEVAPSAIRRPCGPCASKSHLTEPDEVNACRMCSDLVAESRHANRC